MLSPRSLRGIAIVAILAATSLCHGLQFASADDWPHWRGPKFNDCSEETGLLKSWPADGPEQLWVNKSSGLGYAGISIVGEQLFSLGLEDEQEFAICLSVKDGSELWRTPIGPKFQNGWGDGPRSTPAVDGEFVYCMTAQGHLACLKKETGEVTWSVTMADFGGTVPYWGYSESPLVDGEKVVCTPGGDTGTMVALDKATGKKIWQTKPITKVVDGDETAPATAHYSSVIPVELNGKRQYVQLTVVAVVGVDAENGEVLWQSDWPGRTAVIPSPIFNNGEVYVSSGYSIGSKLIKIGDNNQLSELWYTKDMQNHHGGVIQIGDFFYGSSARAFACQRRSDGKTVWSDRNIRKGAVSYADGLFYHVQEDDGKVLLIQADDTNREIKGSFVLSPQSERRNPKGRIWVHPVIANGKLYLRDQEMIYCYDISGK